MDLSSRRGVFVCCPTSGVGKEIGDVYFSTIQVIRGSPGALWHALTALIWIRHVRSRARRVMRWVRKADADLRFGRALTQGRRRWHPFKGGGGIQALVHASLILPHRPCAVSFFERSDHVQHDHKYPVFAPPYKVPGHDLSQHCKAPNL